MAAAGVTDGWADYEIPLVDDTKPVNFIMHLPSGDSVPTTREPGGDRSFVPLQANECGSSRATRRSTPASPTHPDVARPTDLRRVPA